jgi:lysozyme
MEQKEENMLPKSTPKLALSDVEKIIRRHLKLLQEGDAVKLIGVRGYYRDSMGAVGRNDRGIYDDALFIVSPTHFSAWNGNTDPSVARKGIAALAPGVHRYRKGKHGITRPGGGYPAFRPATPGEQLPVTRDGETNPRPGVAINIHRGGYSTTSSEGCQTVPPSQWDKFYAALAGELARHRQTTFPYILTDQG